jgi:hypothetical protein
VDNLGCTIYQKYEYTRDNEDFEKGIELATAAKGLSSGDKPDTVNCLASIIRATGAIISRWKSRNTSTSYWKTIRIHMDAYKAES